MGEQSRSDPDATGSSALEPDGAIERLVALTEEDTSEADFYRTVVTDLVATTAGFGAALWLADGPGLQLAVQHQLSHSAQPSETQAVRLDEVLTGGQCRTFRGRSDSDALEILCPWRFDEREFGVLELRQHTDLSEPALAGQERFVSVVADVILAYHGARRLAAAARREEQWLQIDRFAQAVHRPVDLEATAYEVANEGRRLVDCDRLTVLLRRRSQWRAMAVSGTDCVNRRSSVITHLEMLARLVAAHRSAV